MIWLLTTKKKLSSEKKKKNLYTPIPSTHYSLWDVQLCVSYIFYNSVYGNFVHMGVQQVRLISSIPTIKNIKNEKKNKNLDTRTAETMNFKSMCFFLCFFFFSYDAYDLKEDLSSSLKKKIVIFSCVILYLSRPTQLHNYFYFVPKNSWVVEFRTKVKV